MREAAVGHQCVECVRQHGQGARRPRSVFGGGVVSTPRVTWTLLAINLVVFGAVHLGYDQGVRDLAMQPAGVAFDDQYYRLLSSAFVHVQILHIAFNLWALYVIGPYLERALGHMRYLALYLLSALGGSVLGYLVDQPFQPSIGASGAIFGLFAATFVIGRRLGVDVRGVVMLIVLNLVITFLPGLGISWTAHVGGLVTGAVVSAALAYAPKKSRTLVQAGAVVATLAVLVALVIVRTNQLTGMV
jgi:membrane associated rhomboid family serine protease